MSLLVWYPLNGDTKNKGSLGAELDPTISGVTYTNGNLGKCLDRGALSWTAEQTAKAFHRTTSIAFWIKPIEQTGSACIIGNAGMSANMGRRKYTFYQYSNWKTLHWSWQHDNTENAFFGSTTPLEDGKWNHVVGIQDDATNTCSIYINGILKARSVFPDMPNWTFTYNWPTTIIQDTSFNNICDFRVYDHALSQAEIKELSKGLVIHYDFNNLCGSANWVKNHTEWTAYNDASGGSSMGTKTVDANGVVLIKSVSQNTRLRWQSYPQITAGGKYTLSIKYKQVSGDQTFRWQIQERSSAGSGSVYATHWTTDAQMEKQLDDGWKIIYYHLTVQNTSYIMAWLQEGADYAVYTQTYFLKDFCFEEGHTHSPGVGGLPTKVYNNTGFFSSPTLTDMSFTTNSMHGTQAAHFNGKTSCIDLQTVKTDMFTSDYTLSFWVYPLDNGRAVFFGDYQLIACVNINFERTAGGVFRYYHNGSPDVTFSNTTIPINTWTMITVTYTPGTMKVYKNGVQIENNYSHTATLTKTIPSTMRIGRDSRSGTNANDSGNTAFQGYMDDFRFYTTCLDKDEVLALYKTRARISDMGDIFAGEFVEGQKRAGVKENSVFNSTEVLEEIDPNYDILDGILFTRDEYINTGVSFTDNTLPIYVGGEVTPTMTSGNICLAGCGNSSWSGPVMFNFCGGKLEFGTGTYSTISTEPGLFAANERLTVSAEIGTTTQKWYKNGIHISGLKNGTFVASPATLYIGTFHTNNGSTDTTVGSNNSFNGYVHRFWISYGDIQKQFLPARRKSDGALGMYELVGKQFYISTTGSLSAGNMAHKGTASIYEAGHMSGRNLIEN